MTIEFYEQKTKYTGKKSIIPYASIVMPGHIYLNVAAKKLGESYNYALIGYDKDSHKLAIKLLEIEQVGSYTFPKLKESRNSIAATSALKHFGLLPKKSIYKLPVIFDENEKMFIIDLPKESKND